MKVFRAFESARAASEPLERVARLAPAQLATASLLLALILWVSYMLSFYGWLALFGLLALPLAGGQACLSAAWRIRRGRITWRLAWGLAVLGIALFAAAAVFCYRHWIVLLGLRGFGNLQAYALSAGFAGMVLFSSLWREQRQGDALRVAELERAASVAKLKALQAQVEPHFLYNTLANARYLARTDPDRAAVMLDHLIAYLRHALPDMRSDMSTVERECGLAEHYLSLVAIRFGERFRFRVHCEEPASLADMPPMMLMSLVENAVRHGAESKPGDVLIEVMAETEGDMLRLRVRDDGAGVKTGLSGGGVGLKNLRERLAALYGESARFALRSRAAGGAEAELMLPLVRGERRAACAPVC